MLKSADYPWRWITFSRGNSWFIAPFVSLSVVPFSSCSILSRGHDFLTLMMDDKKLTASDPFSPYITEEPRFIIIIDSGPRSYAAQKVGRKIYASGDMITPMIQQYVQVRSSTISRGRVRLFGLNHILLG